MEENNITMAQKIIDLLLKNNVNEISIETSDAKIKVSKNPVKDTIGATCLDKGTLNDDASTKSSASITSPLVGTIYTSPTPQAAPFVVQGQKVSEDDTVCLIEAMKTYTPIKAKRSGTIAETFMTNGATVEFGQILLTFKDS